VARGRKPVSCINAASRTGNRETKALTGGPGSPTADEVATAERDSGASGELGNPLGRHTQKTTNVANRHPLRAQPLDGLA
jgi:hypothetical protein